MFRGEGCLPPTNLTRKLQNNVRLPNIVLEKAKRFGRMMDNDVVYLLEFHYSVARAYNTVQPLQER